MAKPVIGVLTYRNGKKFFEPTFFRHLIQEGKKLGAIVFLFGPHDVQLAKRKIKGFTPGADKTWKKVEFDWPDIVIDRYRYYPRPQHKDYLAFRRKPLFEYANSQFKSKWKVHEALSGEDEMIVWLPETHVFSKEKLDLMRKEHPLLYVKPTNGTAGRSILRIQRNTSSYSVLGRTLSLKKIVKDALSYEELVSFIANWTKDERLGKEKFLLQQGIDLELIKGRMVDTRILIQKNELGDWNVTGLGIRVGGSNSSTSNLHGGGKAYDPLEVLTKRFGEKMAKEVLTKCRALAYQTAESVEKIYGRMFELGLDVGIDVSGDVYLIEINPKPGRDIFRQLNQIETYREAVRRPLQYALLLLKGRVTV
ncbi:YheC/YheD family endospore coat-associated protein [Brevibacillus daliensis]|uniref:YheC/YheD family endospore coat-associated protein n=1 Tax=Brevibacillus daliensis TaxID=2892995 RepID=UPI001E62B160|nr:YheC/YheD family protein [Brevibacillus daliensis]